MLHFVQSYALPGILACVEASGQAAVHEPGILDFLLFAGPGWYGLQLRGLTWMMMLLGNDDDDETYQAPGVDSNVRRRCLRQCHFSLCKEPYLLHEPSIKILVRNRLRKLCSCALAICTTQECLLCLVTWSKPVPGFVLPLAFAYSKRTAFTEIDPASTSSVSFLMNSRPNCKPIVHAMLSTF